MRPEDILKRLSWRATLRLCETMEQATTWSITGIAAIIGLYLSNLDSVGELVTRHGIRWSIVCFTTSLVCGALSKQIGMAITKGVAMVEELEGKLYTPQGQELRDKMTSSPKDVMREISAPYLWPMKGMMLEGGLRGIDDPLSTEKRFVKLFCAQLYLVWAHWFIAALGLVVVAVSIINA